ncbi:nucleotidyl transferase AbiEii/AbiGii toxin family protein [Kitasatospora sp. NBC_01539]|uniref:nucleotidyl transferase AbiEii/AbiGii toxin family protein n=1 Tax=Kitasatospora sp. NBC_01539 TaxID=2903577 RepID=UPI0038601BD3
MTRPSTDQGPWHDLGYGPWSPELRVPQQRPTADESADLGLPRSLRPVVGDGVVQRPVFDPSLAEFTRALRAGDPEFADPATGAAWYRARRTALDTVLAAVAASPWAEHLVLRGSVLLTAWYGAEAREPGDLDFIVTPADWELDDPRTGEMLRALAVAAGERSAAVRLHADDAAQDEIWTYARVPGRRLVVPWSADGLPGGSVQLDFVFTEAIPTEPVRTAVPPLAGPADGGPGDGAPAVLRTADRELSLAWKLLWLITDGFAQGKDLYDAVLLAESTPLRYELLRRVFDGVDDDWYATRPIVHDDLAEALECVEWDEFRKDHPHLGTADEYAARLLAALAPTFGDRSEDELRALWTAPESAAAAPR